MARFVLSLRNYGYLNRNFCIELSVFVNFVGYCYVIFKKGPDKCNVRIY